MRAFMALILFAALSAPAAGASFDAAAVNGAQWQEAKRAEGAIDPATVKAQVLLDRARYSPGEIDGKLGENVNKAIAAYAADQGIGAADRLTAEVWQKLTAGSPEPVLKDYKLTEDDVRGPFAEKIPAKMEAMKDLPALSYRNAREKIAEKFHMSPELLQKLNPGQTFDKAGATILVAAVAEPKLAGKAARLAVDKDAQTLKAFDKQGKLLAFYPVTVGSAEKPAPSGRLKVTGVSKNPTYRYNPDYAFKGVKSREPFTIKPGPNNPVGVVWIGLNQEGYGIHGTPEPAKVSKTESHGCIRMTNWDALTLASAVGKGTPVEFIGERKASEARAQAVPKAKSRTKRR
jgi:lipoprotein-anchoring transpeptidase ErfK/SrfK